LKRGRRVGKSIEKGKESRKENEYRVRKQSRVNGRKI